MADDKEAAMRQALEKLNAEKAALLMRAETAEAYLQQAEARIEELEQLVHELASKVPQSDIEFLSGSEWDKGLTDMLEEKQRRFSEMYGGLKEWQQKLDGLTPEQRHQLMQQFREKYFDYFPEKDEYRRKPIDPDRKATDEFRKRREDAFRREYQALKNQIPPELKKEAEKYLNDFLGNDALGKRQADEFEERKTGGVPGARYRIEFRAAEPGSVQLFVENTQDRFKIPGPNKVPKNEAAYWTQRMPDNMSPQDLMKHAAQLAADVVNGLKIGGEPGDARAQFAKDVYEGYQALRTRGGMRFVVER